MRALLEGGPEGWAGSVVNMADRAERAERTLRETWEQDDEYVLGVWKRTGRIVPVEVSRRRRQDVVVETKAAVVFEFDSIRRVSKDVKPKQPERQLGLL